MDIQYAMTIYKSPWGEVKDVYYGNVAQFIRDSPNVQTNLDKEIFVDANTNESLTTRQMLELTGRFSYLLRETYSIAYDDVVCVFGYNSIHTPIIHHGILSRGAIVSPASSSYNSRELKHQLAVSQSKLLIVARDLRSIAEEAAVGTNIGSIVTVEELLNEIKQTTGLELPVILNGKSSQDKHAYYCMSSGTSGLSKCVVLTHLNISVNVQQQWQSGPDLYHTDYVYAAIVPMSHSYGLSKFCYLTPYLTAKTVVFRKFNFELLLKSICDHKINALHAVPPIVVMLAKSPLVDQYPIKNYLKKVTSGAAPLGEGVMKAVENRINASVTQSYGLTESSPINTSYQYDLKLYNKASIGWLVPSCDAKVVDPDEKDVPQGSRGELWLRGPHIFKGYLRNSRATNETLTSDGWLRTGDIAIVDKTGQYYIVDRAKELIKSKGNQVAPAELEDILVSHPHVVDAAVTGYYVEEEATELPRAYLVLRPEGDPLEIKRWFDTQVARHKRLWGGIVVIDSVPKNPSGKILRRLLRDRKDEVVVGYPLAKL